MEKSADFFAGAKSGLPKWLTRAGDWGLGDANSAQNADAEGRDLSGGPGYTGIRAVDRGLARVVQPKGRK
jgi:hypothetical protein